MYGIKPIYGFDFDCWKIGDWYNIDSIIYACLAKIEETVLTFKTYESIDNGTTLRISEKNIYVSANKIKNKTIELKKIRPG